MSHPASTKSIAVADALHSASIHLLRRLRREDERAGISAAKLSALSVLVFAGPMRLTELARAEQVRPPTMTKLVAGMAREGLVRRSPDRDDARAVRLAASAKGTRILQEGRRRRIARLAAVLDALPAQDVDTIERAAKLVDSVARQVAEGGTQ
jgi:DNA-binding MarR family transcriptional regulator